MAKKQFKAESKKLLEMMINSIYTHKEIFLRELISNASDAIDKLYFRGLSDETVGLSREDFHIDLEVNEEERTLTISDNGIGMTKEELEKNLGTIAKSGSLEFKKENDGAGDVDIIGQFGVGFYSAFMVSDEVTVTSKAFGSDEAYIWKSSGADGYTISEAEKEEHGTTIVLHIKENAKPDEAGAGSADAGMAGISPEGDADGEDYDEYLNKYKISGLVKKYSDYISYPILMDFETSKPVPKSDDDPEDAPPKYETVIEKRTLNSMVPLWRKNKSEITDEEYNTYYREKFFDFTEPLAVIHTKAEGQAVYDALMFIPAQAPFNYYSKDFERGLALYSNGVMIMEKCQDLLPEYFSFVRGVVDSEDLSLNISREMLQHDRQLKVIAKNIKKKIRSELEKMQKNDREKYEKFFQQFGPQIKFGVYDGYGMYKDELKDLLIYYSSMEKKPVTLKEYVEKMGEEQTSIYYACGDTIAQIDSLPQTDGARQKGYEVLYMTDEVDEFAIRMLGEYDGKRFVNICSGEFDTASEDEKEELKKKNEDLADALQKIKDVLGDEVQDVRLTGRLSNYPVCLTSEGDISIEMEKTINAMPHGEKVKAQVALEINDKHEIVEKIKNAASDDEKIKKYAKILYSQARIIAGLPIEDPSELSELICEMM